MKEMGRSRRGENKRNNEKKEQTEGETDMRNKNITQNKQYKNSKLR